MNQDEMQTVALQKQRMMMYQNDQTRLAHKISEDMFYYHYLYTVLEYFPVDAPLQVLDVGCGEAKISKLISMNFENAKIYAVDYNSPSLKIARNKAGRNITFYRVKIEELHLLLEKRGVPKYSFDIIIASEVYEHLNEPNILINIVQQYLKDGGIYLFSTPSGWMMRQLRFSNFRSLLKETSSFRTKLFPEKDWQTALRYHPGSRFKILKRMFLANGLQVVRRESLLPYYETETKQFHNLVFPSQEKSLLLRIARIHGTGCKLKSSMAIGHYLYFMQGLMNLLGLRYLEARIFLVVRKSKR